MSTIWEEFGDTEYQRWWCEELGLGRRRAFQILNVYEKFGSSAQYALDFQVAALYLLSAPSTPESARTEAIEKAEAGEQITHKQARN